MSFDCPNLRIKVKHRQKHARNVINYIIKTEQLNTHRHYDHQITIDIETSSHTLQLYSFLV